MNNGAKSAGASHGDHIEEVAREIAATLGVPDVVYTVPKISKGPGVREVGDALLITNGFGGVLAGEGTATLRVRQS